MSKLLVIDAGHGGRDGGGGSNDLWKEKDMTLDISLYQEKRCKELGIPYVMTRTSDVYLEPVLRANIVKNSGAKYCFSNHINSADPSAKGFEVIKSIFNKSDLGENIYEAMKHYISGRRVFTRKFENDNTDYYFMHRLTGNVQTYIIEYGFASNSIDTQILMNNWRGMAEIPIKVLCLKEGIKYTVPAGSVDPTLPVEGATMDKWKVELLKRVYDAGLLTEYEEWKKELDNDIPTWAVLAMLENLDNKLQDMINGKVGECCEKKDELPEYIYGKYQDKIYMVKSQPNIVKVAVVNGDIDKLDLFDTAINGSFFWYEDAERTRTYANAVLVSNGNVLGKRATHADKADRSCPQSVLVIYKDGSVDVVRIKDADQISRLREVSFAIGGLGVIVPYGKNYKAEGFYSPYNDVLRATNKTFIGYQKSSGLIFAGVVEDASHEELEKIGLEFKLDYMISLDGGGSSCLKAHKDVKVKGDGRKRHHYIVFDE